MKTNTASSILKGIIVARFIESETVEREFGSRCSCEECDRDLPTDRLEGFQRWLTDVSVGEEVTLDTWDAEDLDAEPVIEVVRCCQECADDLRSMTTEAAAVE